MGKLEKEIMLLMGKGSLIPPKTVIEYRDRIVTLLGDVLEIVKNCEQSFRNLNYGAEINAKVYREMLQDFKGHKDLKDKPTTELLNSYALNILWFMEWFVDGKEF